MLSRVSHLDMQTMPNQPVHRMAAPRIRLANRESQRGHHR